MNSKNENPVLAGIGHGAKTNKTKLKESYINAVDLSTLKRTVDHVAVAESLGIFFRATGGGRHVACCPIHKEKTGSFFAYPDGRFFCFGCQWSGDVIALTQKLLGKDFKSALRFLGLSESRDLTAADHRAIEEAAHKRRLVKKFRAWESIFADELGIMIRAIRRTLARCGDELFESDPAFFQWCSNELTKCEYYLELLLSGSDRARYLLYKEAGDRHHMPKTCWQYEVDRLISEVTP